MSAPEIHPSRARGDRLLARVLHQIEQTQEPGDYQRGYWRAQYMAATFDLDATPALAEQVRKALDAIDNRRMRAVIDGAIAMLKVGAIV